MTSADNIFRCIVFVAGDRFSKASPLLSYADVRLTLCTLMDFQIHIDTISIGLPIVYFERPNELISVPGGCLTLAKSADPDEMQHYVTLHLGLHCSPKFQFRGFQ